MASPHVAGSVALCLSGGPCAGKNPSQIVQQLRSDAQSHTDANHGYGFMGHLDNNPVSGRYFWYLAWDGADLP
jgi:subtilisin